MPGLRLLVVRPRKANDELTQILDSESCVVHQLPVMAIVGLTQSEVPSEIARLLKAFAANDMAIFISRNAAQAGLALLRRYCPELPGAMAYFAVGETTAAVLNGEGIDAVIPAAEFNTEGLLALPQLQQVAGKRIVIFKGEGGRDLLRETLVARGAEVSCCDVYRRELDKQHRQAILELLSAGQLDAVIVHSGELLHNLLSVADDRSEQLLSLPVIVPGQRVAQLAVEAGFSQIVTSASATAVDMVSALWGWYSSRR